MQQPRRAAAVASGALLLAAICTSDLQAREDRAVAKPPTCDARTLAPNVLVSRARARLDKVFGPTARRSYEPYTVTPTSDGWRVEGTFKGSGDVMGGAPIVTFSRCGEITGVLLGV